VCVNVNICATNTTIGQHDGWLQFFSVSRFTVNKKAQHDDVCA